MTSPIATRTDPATLDAWAAELSLHPGVVRQLCAHYEPLAARLAAERRAMARPLLLAINGAQGSGKSTLLSLLLRILPQVHGLRAAGLSLDDLYLTAAERRRLARDVHPLLATRGVPGTHDLALGHRVLDALCDGGAPEAPEAPEAPNARHGSVALPRFDKASDDRVPEADWPRVDAPPQVVILEGWCVGARPQTEEALREPINALERAHDTDGRWRRHVNDQLRHEYRNLFDRFDRLLMLAVPDMDCVVRWRTAQERALAGKLAAEGRADTTMDGAAVASFVQHFERLTRHMLQEMPAHAHILIPIDADHQLVRVEYRDPEPHR